MATRIPNSAAAPAGGWKAIGPKGFGLFFIQQEIVGAIL
jgi:hypothetical protein